VRLIRKYSTYLKERFGEPVLKVPLDAGFTCPNRDGTRGRGGCSYCDNRAFSPVAGTGTPCLDQLRRGILRAPRRFRRFIAYFQAYSGTYAEPELLSRLHAEVLGVPGVIGIAIATRPDCLSREVIDYLSGLSRKTYLAVELGVQTLVDRTLRTICRGHTAAESAAALAHLERAGIEVTVHCMLGLPGEGPAEAAFTMKTLAGLPVFGVKFHQLMILAETPLHQAYLRGEVAVLTLEDYAALLADSLQTLPEGVVVHRLLADSSPARGLVAPLWSCRKRSSLAYLEDYLRRRGLGYSNSRLQSNPG